jgi:hypothetical protein
MFNNPYDSSLSALNSLSRSFPNDNSYREKAKRDWQERGRAKRRKSQGEKKKTTNATQQSNFLKRYFSVLQKMSG